MADHSSELLEFLRRSGSQARELLASARDSLQAARKAMAEADRVLAGEKPKPDDKRDGKANKPRLPNSDNRSA